MILSDTSQQVLDVLYQIVTGIHVSLKMNSNNFGGRLKSTIAEQVLVL